MNITKGNFSESVLLIDNAAIKTFVVNNETTFEDIKNEYKILSMLKGNDHVIEVNEITISNDLKISMFFEKYDHDIEFFTESKAKFSTTFVKAMLFQSLEAISFIHSKGIVHFDIKPSNILVEKNGNLKLCDFGFATKLKKYETIDDEDFKVGSSAYCDIEFYKETRYIGPLCDLWSLGCTVYELIFGRVRGFRKSDFLESLKNDIIKANGTTQDQKNLLEILCNMLNKTFDKRSSAKKILKHPFFNGMDIDSSKEIIKNEIFKFNDMNNKKRAFDHKLNNEYKIIKSELNDSFCDSENYSTESSQQSEDE